MGKKAKEYAVTLKYKDGFVGTLSEIEEWMEKHNINLHQCGFWELEEEVHIDLAKEERS
jgi:hypothetical protein